jgi:hypothetical protein
MQEIQIEGEDKFKGIVGPNVNIGFRIVLSYVRPKTKWEKKSGI